MSRCRSCEAPVMFARTPYGKLAILDAQPNPAGNIVLVDGVAHVMRFDERPDLPRYRSHFATCPQAAQHRRAARGT